MDILLDTNVIVDICTKREPYFSHSLAAFLIAKTNSFRIWVYVGSVPILYRQIADEIRKSGEVQGKEISAEQAQQQSKKLLHSFSQNINWLAALSYEGDVFGDGDPITNQLIKALDRFGRDAKLLIREEDLLERNSNSISVAEFILRYESTKEPRLQFIDLATQQDFLRNQLEHHMHTVLHHGQYILGPEIRELEEKLAKFVGVKHAITCSSGTDALLMPLMALEIGPGDAVFTSPFTFVATAEVVTLLGATPVFVDIDPRTFNIDPEKLDKAIKSLKKKGNLRLRGIIPVDLFGLPADYDRITAIANKENLFVLEDAAQALGGIYKSRPAGSLAQVAATSFFPAKPLGGYGDGGAIFTNDAELAEKLISIRVHGKGGHKYENIRVGLNGRLDTLQAALLLPKLAAFPEELKKRQWAAKKYSEKFQDLSVKLKCPFIPKGLQSAWAQYSVLSDRRDHILEGLKKEGIPTAIYYPTPLHLQPAFSKLGYQEGDFPVSELVSHRIFSLPMGPYLTEEQINLITNAIENIQNTT